MDVISMALKNDQLHPSIDIVTLNKNLVSVYGHHAYTVTHIYVGQILIIQRK